MYMIQKCRGTLAADENMLSITKQVISSQRNTIEEITCSHYLVRKTRECKTAQKVLLKRAYLNHLAMKGAYELALEQA